MALLYEHTFVPVALLTALTRGQDTGTLRFTNLHSGPYSFCAGDDAFMALMEGRSPPKEKCASGFLNAGGQLVLSPGTFGSESPTTH